MARFRRADDLTEERLLFVGRDDLVLPIDKSLVSREVITEMVDEANKWEFPDTFLV